MINCIQRYRSYNGTILAYKLIENNRQTVIEANELKRLMQTRNVVISNLKLTRDGRIVTIKPEPKTSQIKMITIDLDGTLLMADNTIPEKVVKLLNRVSKLGIKVVIATGRIYPSAKIYADKLDRESPIICYNGSMITTISGKILYEQYVDVETIRNIANYCKDKNLYLQMYSDDKIIVEKDCKELRMDPDSKTTSFVELGDLTKTRLEPSPKLMILDSPNRVKEIFRETACLFGGRLNVTMSTDWLVELLPKGVSKKNTIAALCNQYKITRDEVLAIGDGLNDREMLRWAGIGAAVNNAHTLTKTMAEYVANNARSYGVAEAVTKFTGVK